MHSDMEIWREIRRELMTGALSKRATITKYGIGWHTLKKMLAHDEPLGYRPSNQIDERRRTLHTMTIDRFLGGMRRDQNSESFGERLGGQISTCSTMCCLHDVS